MNKLEALEALGIKLPKELFACEIKIEVNPSEEKVDTIIKGSGVAIRVGLLTLISEFIDKGIFKDIDKIKDDYIRMFKKDGEANE